MALATGEAEGGRLHWRGLNTTAVGDIQGRFRISNRASIGTYRIGRRCRRSFGFFARFGWGTIQSSGRRGRYGRMANGDRPGTCRAIEDGHGLGADQHGHGQPGCERDVEAMPGEMCLFWLY